MLLQGVETVNCSRRFSSGSGKLASDAKREHTTMNLCNPKTNDIWYDGIDCLISWTIFCLLTLLVLLSLGGQQLLQQQPSFCAMRGSIWVSEALPQLPRLLLVSFP